MYIYSYTTTLGIIDRVHVLLVLYTKSMSSTV